MKEEKNNVTPIVPEAPEVFNLALEVESINQILTSLGQQPYVQVFKLMSNIQVQLSTQNKDE